ncbi:MAG: RedB protein [Myxococcales bacterium]
MPRWVVIGVVLWAGAVAASVYALADYKNTPGRAALAPEGWPQESALSREPGLPTLLVVAHPRCPCTRATLTELAKIMERARGRVTAHVLFVQHGEADPTGTELWEKASAIPGVRVSLDRGGVEAGRFDAATSGQTVLYAASGARLFKGGITGSRGHEGDNAGSQAVLAQLLGAAAAAPDTDVYGCSL